jgi:protein-S-isoprenylcysteine O-methyltransferase Ste14
MLRAQISNALLSAWILADVLRLLLLSDRGTSDFLNFAIVLTLLVNVAFVIGRPLPTRQDLSAPSMVIVAAALAWPLIFMALDYKPVLPSTAAAVAQIFSILLMFATIFALGGNFSVFPQYRKIVVRGPYAMIRHPLYAAYLIFDAVFACEQQSALAIMFWVTECLILAWRADREEKLLTHSAPDYIEYLSDVRYRFLPLIY